jgi:hypothetical protein
MSTIELAKAKYARKMATAGAKWKQGVTGKAEAYAEGMAAFGAPVGSVTRASYSAGVEAVSADAFQRTVTGKEEKWARKLKAAVSV